MTYTDNPIIIQRATQMGHDHTVLATQYPAHLPYEFISLAPKDWTITHPEKLAPQYLTPLHPSTLINCGTLLNNTYICETLVNNDFPHICGT